MDGGHGVHLYLSKQVLTVHVQPRISVQLVSLLNEQTFQTATVYSNLLLYSTLKSHASILNLSRLLKAITI